MAFGFFKKMFGGKQSSGLPKELSAFMEQMQKDIFPNGIEQQKKELSEVAGILGVPAARISGTFSYACSRAFMGNCDKDTLINGIARHKDGLSDSQIEKFARYIFTKLIKQKAGISDPVFIEESLNALGFLKDNYGGIKYDEIPGGYGDFGITITNPVPANGIPSSDKYLSRLVTFIIFPMRTERPERPFIFLLIIPQHPTKPPKATNLSNYGKDRRQFVD